MEKAQCTDVEKIIECINFADDILVLRENGDEQGKILKNLKKLEKKNGINTNIKNTKIMITKGKKDKIKLDINGEDIEEVKKFAYFGNRIPKHELHSRNKKKDIIGIGSF